MTDRIHSLTVILDRDIREDDAESLIHAIKYIKGVIDVKQNISDIDYAVAESRVELDIKKKLYTVFKS